MERQIEVIHYDPMDIEDNDGAIYINESNASNINAETQLSEAHILQIEDVD